MKISVSEIKEKAISLSADEPIDTFPALEAMQREGECRFLSPVRIELSVVKEFELIRVQGRVATSVAVSCSRCLVEYESGIDSSFTVFYTLSDGEPAEEEVELTEEDLLSATYDGDEIDFGPVTEEQVILAIPLKPLCKEDCLGLCSNCGADLNTAPCACDRSSISLKFSALKNLKIEK